MKKISVFLMGVLCLFVFSCADPSGSSNSGNDAEWGGVDETQKPDDDADEETKNEIVMDKENARLVLLEDVYASEDQYGIYAEVGETIKIPINLLENGWQYDLSPMPSTSSITEHQIENSHIYIVILKDGYQTLRYENKECGYKFGDAQKVYFYIIATNSKTKEKNNSAVSELKNRDEAVADFYNFDSADCAYGGESVIDVYENHTLYIPNVPNYNSVTLQAYSSDTEILDRCTLTLNRETDCYEFYCKADSDFGEGRIYVIIVANLNGCELKKKVKIHDFTHNMMCADLAGIWHRKDAESHTITFYADGTYVLDCENFYQNEKGTYSFGYTDQGKKCIIFSHNQLGEVEYRLDGNTLTFYSYLYFTCPKTSVWVRKI